LNLFTSSQASDAPGYLPGKVASLILYCSLGVVALILRWVNKRLNVKKAEVLAQTIAANGWSEDDVQRERDRAAFLDMTDKENIFFTYVE
jgi:ACS family allantoate permease-like MFS transporter